MNHLKRDLCMTIITGLSGNEIFCLAQKGYKPGNLIIGNSIYSLGLVGSFTSGFKALAGGEITEITKLIEEGRESAYKRMVNEAINAQATGITGTTSELISHLGKIEFLSKASAVHAINPSSDSQFSTSADGKELLAQLDAGYKPICFSFGNVAYSLGVSKNVLGGLKTMGRGEIKEYSDIFKHTRHLALERIQEHGKKYHANAIVGINTSIIPFGGVSEMLMIGTASHHHEIASALPGQVVTSGMTNIEMWNMANMGYVPLRLMLGTSVYSLGLAGGISSAFKSFVRGEINELTTLIYEARENALGIIRDEARDIGADEVIGTKLYVHQFGGLIEFLAIGTAVKKIDNIKTESATLPAQAITVDQNTFFDSTRDQTNSDHVTTQNDTANSTSMGPNFNIVWNVLKTILIFVIILMVVFRFSWNSERGFHFKTFDAPRSTSEW